MENLTKNDYIKILEYYHIKIPKTYKNIKKKATNILNDKLCRCVRKLQPEHQNKSIGICKKSVLHSKQITTRRFSCKKKKSVLFKKKKTLKNK